MYVNIPETNLSTVHTMHNAKNAGKSTYACVQLLVRSSAAHPQSFKRISSHLDDPARKVILKGFNFSWASSISSQ